MLFINCPLDCKRLHVRAGNGAVLNFNLDSYATKAQVLAAVDRITFLGQNSRDTIDALRLARLRVLDPAYRRRPEAWRLVVLITDGNPSQHINQLDSEVAAIKALDARIVAFGIIDLVLLLLLLILILLLLLRLSCRQTNRIKALKYLNDNTVTIFTTGFSFISSSSSYYYYYYYYYFVITSVVKIPMFKANVKTKKNPGTARTRIQWV